jgi:lipoteichoic acid synthase
MNLLDIKKVTIGIILISFLTLGRILLLNFSNHFLLSSVLEIMIFTLSLFLLGYFIYQNRVNIINSLSLIKDKLIIISTMITVEVLFLVKNSIDIENSYVFSLLFTHLILILISIVLPKKLSRIYDVLLLLIFSIYIISQDFFYRIFTDFYSFKEAPTIKEGAEAADGMFVLEPLYILILIVLIIGLVSYFKNISHHKLELNLKTYKNISFFGILLITFISLNINYKIDENRIHTSDLYLYHSIYNRTYFSKKYSMANLMFIDLVDSLTLKNAKENDFIIISNYFEQNKKNHQDHLYTGIFKDKNLIFILAESYDEMALSIELTPNLYKLKHEGIHFSNHFTPVFPRTTSDTEFIINTSLIPSIEDGPTISKYKDNSYSNSLAMLFNSQGYITNAFHGNHKRFYSRDIIYQNYGYHQFYDQSDLGLTDENKRFDQLFYQNTKDLILNQEQPFFSFIITFSGHSPYSSQNQVASKHYNIVDDFYQDQISEAIKYYIATQIELDLMISNLLIDLEVKNLLDDTVIILTGDHYPYTMPHRDYERFTQITENHLKQRGNLYIWHHDLVATNYESLTTSFDILPIINNMFLLNGNFDHYIGNDIYNTSSNFVLYKDYKIYDGYHLMHLNDLYLSNQIDLIIKSEKYYQVSKSILRTDYFKIP